MPSSSSSSSSSRSSLIRIEDASLKGGYKVAGRKLIRIFLEASLNLDGCIQCFHVHDVSQLLCLCTGKLAHLWSLTKHDCIYTFGKTNAGHRSSILSCQISPSGLYLLTGGEDGRVVLWNIPKQKAEKILEFHQSSVTFVSFALNQDDLFVSASEDCQLIFYERYGVGLHSLYHHRLLHATSFKTGTVSVGHGINWCVFLGSNHGDITICNGTTKSFIYTISAEPDWPGTQLLSHLQTFTSTKPSTTTIATTTTTKMDDPPSTPLNSSVSLHPDQHHSGAILSLSISKNRLFLASGSMDGTCKLWNVASLFLEPLPFMENSPTQLSTYIPVWDATPLYNEVSAGETHIGQIEFEPGHEAILVWTYLHEGPVTSLCFTEDSDMVLTGSIDCTIRLWSVLRGNLLFQINTPGPVHQLHLTHSQFYAICDHRILTFTFSLGPWGTSVRSSSSALLKKKKNRPPFTSFSVLNQTQGGNKGASIANQVMQTVAASTLHSSSSSSSKHLTDASFFLNPRLNGLPLSFPSDALYSFMQESQHTLSSSSSSSSWMPFYGHVYHYLPQAAQTKRRLKLKQQLQQQQVRKDTMALKQSLRPFPSLKEEAEEKAEEWMKNEEDDDVEDEGQDWHSQPYFNSRTLSYRKLKKPWPLRPSRLSSFHSSFESTSSVSSKNHFQKRKKQVTLPTQHSMDEEVSIPPSFTPSSSTLFKPPSEWISQDVPTTHTSSTPSPWTHTSFFSSFPSSPPTLTLVPSSNPTLSPSLPTSSSFSSSSSSSVPSFPATHTSDPDVDQLVQAFANTLPVASKLSKRKKKRSVFGKSQRPKKYGFQIHFKIGHLYTQPFIHDPNSNTLKLVGKQQSIQHNRTVTLAKVNHETQNDEVKE